MLFKGLPFISKEKKESVDIEIKKEKLKKRIEEVIF